MKISPSQGSSLSLAPVARISMTSASPSTITAASPKLGLTKLPASGASGGNGRGLAGLANSFGRRLEVGLSALEIVRNVVDVRVAENPVEDPGSER